MRHFFAALTCAAVVLAAQRHARALETKPAPNTTPTPLLQPAQVEKIERWEPTPDWLIAIERLRLNPKPAEIETAAITCGVTEIFALSKSDEQKIDAILAGYNAEVLKKAAKWDEELKATRSEYEARIIATLPEAKRDEAKKLLELSHAKWVAPLEREQKFTQAFLEHEKAFKEETKGKSPEEVSDARDALKAWVKVERARINQDEENLVAALKALLTPEEAQNLEKFNRHRTIAPQAAPPKAPPQKK